ncbi:MAG: pirin family protein [Pseudomonadota bacterium]
MSNALSSPDADCSVEDCRSEAVDMVIRPREKDLGGGFKVRRVLPFHKRRMVGPFIFFDHFGPATYAPGEGFDVRPHPHIGLATVTYLFEGAIAHKDTVGSDIVIRPGAVNLMTAGRGIVHSERTPPGERASGQAMHGLQTWIALPKEHEACPPAFSHHPADELPAFDLGGAQVQLLMGTAFGRASPVPFPWGILYAAGQATEGAAFTISAEAAEERAVYVVSGTVTVDDQTFAEGAMVVLTPGCDVSLTLGPETKVAICGGQPMDGPRLIEWNLVATDKALIEQAKADWADAPKQGWTGRFTLPAGEAEFIPLP